MKPIREYWHLITLAIITLFGFLLRLHNLDWQCLKIDELVTQTAALTSTMDIIRWSLSVDYNPPLYYLLAHWSSIAFGEASRFALRFPALILGTLAIPASYYLAKEVKGITAGLLTASLVSFMFPFYYYSQDARAYPLVLLTFICFSYFWVKLYNGDNEQQPVLGTALFAALSLWSHYYSFVPIIIMGTFLLWKHNKTAIKAAGLTFALLLPMAFLFDFAQFSTRTTHELFNVLWVSPAMTATILPNEMLCWSWIVIVPLAICTLLKYRDPIIRIFAVAGIITPALLIPLAQITAIMPRYAILVSPLILITAMVPISDLIDNQKTLIRKITIFISILFLIFLLNFQSIIMWNTFDTCPLVSQVR